MFIWPFTSAHKQQFTFGMASNRCSYNQSIAARLLILPLVDSLLPSTPRAVFARLLFGFPLIPCYYNIRMKSSGLNNAYSEMGDM